MIAAEGEPLIDRMVARETAGVRRTVKSQPPWAAAQNRPISIEYLREQLGTPGKYALRIGRDRTRAGRFARLRRVRY